MLVLLLVFLLPHASAAQGDPHIRIVDRTLKALFELGQRESPSLRSLVAEVEGASVLVFIDCAMRMPHGVWAGLNLVTSVNGVRYVRVIIDCSVPVKRQIALLAHELQHALEIAGRADIVDVNAMEAYYEEIGFQTFKNGTHKSFETDAALAVQRAVYGEISGRHVRIPARPRPREVNDVVGEIQ